MIKRESYLKKIRKFYHLDLIKVITGIRRSGKSALLMQIMEELRAEGVEESQILYINFEDSDFSLIRTKANFFRHIRERVPEEKQCYLFFDEIQIVPEFARIIGSLRVKYGASIFITGSNSRFLLEALEALPAGWYVSLQIMPFSFREMCEIRNISPKECSEEILLDYMEWGGMPQRFILRSEEQIKNFLWDVYETIVLRHMVLGFGVRDIALFKQVFAYLVSNSSRIFSVTAIMEYFQSKGRKVSKETIYNYLDYMTASCMITKAARYDIREKRVLTKMDKYYLTDLGLGRIQNSGFKLEMGALLENVVYNELLIRGYEVYVGKTRSGEVDFVAMKDGQKEYYQVVYYLYDQRVIDREFGALSDIADNYPKYVISFDRADYSREGMIHKNALKFLLEE